MAKMIFDEEGLLDEPCLSCDKPYVEDIWNEWCCDEKECPYKIKIESEDKCMEAVEVKTTIYITDDGKRFDNLELAEKHEKRVKALEKLKTFKIDGPCFTPFDDYKLLAYNWQWYKVNDQDELYQVLILAAKVYAMKKHSDDGVDFDEAESRFYNEICIMYDFLYSASIEQKRKFPKYIAISFNQKCINTLDNIEKQHEIEMERWKRFYQYFKNDDLKNNGGSYEDKDME